MCERHWQIPGRKSLPVVYLFVLYDPCRRGKSGTDHFCSSLSAKNDFHTKPFYLYYYLTRWDLYVRNVNELSTEGSCDWKVE